MKRVSLSKSLIQRATILGLFLAVLVTSGCAGVGHGRIEGERSNYNVAIQRSNDEQLLLNLVRLRYRDTPFFLEVSSVATQFTYSAGANAGSRLESGVKGIFNLGADAAIEERPTVTYAPLQGEDFIHRFLSQVPMQTIVLLARTGWSLERVFRVCFQNLGPLKNAPNASGPTPATAPEYEPFLKAAKLVRAINLKNGLQVSLGENGTISGLVLQLNDRGRKLPQTKELLQLLKMPLDSKQIFFTTQPVPDNKPYLRAEARSLIGIMYYLSHSVDTPEADRERGRVTVTRDKDGKLFDWDLVTGDLMHVRTSHSKPENAIVAVEYRGEWYFLDDTDLGSKSTFSMLGQLFSLQSGNAKALTPTLTLPVGN
ncbi:MAG: hypothetical protein G3M70_14445 [Candidatus Nitronauta litoralis]|uniref:Uncharacterized protein n=1 Tax=Candidatus Nitronauta litoralis TaxID=2705533 RepID=A0A7T0BXY7_9BACT|nr:MAG: hypothetical protein G3M70_14445 [Candidatus Nitronauta litoralis]